MCHCILIEASDRLLLVETGLGTADVSDPSRLPWPPPFGLRLFQRTVDSDRRTREANRARLQALATEHGDEVTVINAHDPELLAPVPAVD